MMDPIAINEGREKIEREIFSQKILFDNHSDTTINTKFQRNNDLNTTSDKLVELIQGVLKLPDLTGSGGRNDQHAHHITTSALTTLPRSSNNTKL